MGTCIGKRNYLAFVCFVNGCTAQCLYVLAACIVEIWLVKQGIETDEDRGFQVCALGWGRGFGA